MSNLSHDMLVELLRHSDEMVRELFILQTGIKLHDLVADHAPALPPELHHEDAPDHLIVFRDTTGLAAHALVIEVQLDVQARKEQLWPPYVAALRTVLQCPVSLLIVAPDPRVARWARTAIEICHGEVLTPVAVSFREVPRIVDLHRARKAPELAFLSALAHPELDVVIAACDALISMADLPRSLHYGAILRAELGHLFDEEALDAAPSAADLNDPRSLMVFLRARRAREPVVRLLLELLRSRMPSVSKREEEDVRFIASKDGAIIHLLSGLARAHTPDHARQAIERATVCRIHGIRPSAGPTPPQAPLGGALASARVVASEWPLASAAAALGARKRSAA
jgi:hypothetical protein